jgi:hypothetical protein
MIRKYATPPPALFIVLFILVMKNQGEATAMEGCSLIPEGYFKIRAQRNP